MAIRLSALRACHPLPPMKIPGTHFCYRLSQPQAHSVPGRIRSIEKNPPHQDSTPRPSGLQHSASTNYATMCTIYLGRCGNNWVNTGRCNASCLWMLWHHGKDCSNFSSIGNHANWAGRHQVTVETTKYCQVSFSLVNYCMTYNY
jgi:hypothetical protein